MGTELFRKSALEALSSPEQLDQLMKSTSPRSWIALSAIGLVLLAALIWSVFGNLPTTVSGSGIIMRKGGVLNLVATGTGVITEMREFKIGEPIQRGQVLGTIAQPVLEQQIESAQAQVAQLLVEAGEVQSTLADDSSQQLAEFSAQGGLQRRLIAAREEQLTSLREVEKGQQILLRDGLITRQRLEEARQAILAAQNEIVSARAEMQKIEVARTESRLRQGDRVRGDGSRLAQAQQRLQELQAQHRLSTDIVSRHDGVVIEQLAINGDEVRDGQAVLSLEAEHRQLHAVVYLPPGSNAKLLKPGMSAQISPVTSQKERYGFLEGRILTVSEYPATEQGMLSMLNSSALVQEFSRAGPPIAVVVEFILDPDTASGYAWSSRAGGGVELSSGTLCAGSFMVEKKRPISLVIPMLKESVGL